MHKLNGIYIDGITLLSAQEELLVIRIRLVGLAQLAKDSVQNRYALMPMSHAILQLLMYWLRLALLRMLLT